MIFKNRIISIISLSILLIGSIAWTYLQIYRQSTAPNAYNENEYDYLMTKVEIKRFNRLGKLSSSLMTPLLIHYPYQDKITFDTPFLRIQQPGHPPWEINAQKGLSLNHGTELILEDNVRIHQAASAQGNETTLLTSKLYIYPEKDLAETDQPVKIMQPGITVSAIGMRINLKTNRVELFSKAKGKL